MDRDSSLNEQNLFVPSRQFARSDHHAFAKNDSIEHINTTRQMFPFNVRKRELKKNNQFQRSKSFVTDTIVAFCPG